MLQISRKEGSCWINLDAKAVSFWKYSVYPESEKIWLVEAVRSTDVELAFGVEKELNPEYRAEEHSSELT